ncbi:MAG TPA: 5'-methylthioadenosine/adenosylhomocysteine nucleosidase [Cyclobacteriaceae bacterium]|nr:5'-methylthioadenosine/adenosylhomocysteine nucleosidase [Cyclobacteriaceae bacterium]
MRILPFIFLVISLATHAQSQVVVPVYPEPAYNREYRPITGILGAFDQEIKYLLSIVTNKNESIIQRISFTEGELNGKKVVIAQTGIGKVNAAIVTTLMIEHFMPKEIVFTGIAGGTNPGLSPGDIVIGTRVAYHDYGTLTRDSLMRRPTRNPFTQGDNPVFYECDPKLVEKAVLAATEAKFEKLKTSEGERYPKVIRGTIVTGDVFVSSNAAVKDLRSKLNADATEMEGAAVAQVCLQVKQPFVVVRSLSDNAGDSSVGEVKQFYKLAAQNSASLVVALVGML